MTKALAKTRAAVELALAAGAFCERGLTLWHMQSTFALSSIGSMNTLDMLPLLLIVGSAPRNPCCAREGKH